MLTSLANDDVWNKVSWKGTESKISFMGELPNIHKAIKKIANQTFSKSDASYYDSRIKTFLRHTSERIDRASRKIDDED